MERGEIWWASLPPPTGSGPGGRRPVLVVQADAFTASRIATIIVAVATSNLDLARAPGNVLLDEATSGLGRASVVNVSQVLTIDRRALTERVASLPWELVGRVDRGLSLVLDL